MNQYFKKYSKTVSRFFLSLTLYILFFPSITSASIGDSYFCEDINFSIYENDKFEKIQNFKFFLKWSEGYIEYKFLGEDYWRSKEIIVYQDKDSFLAWQLDDVGGTGVSTVSLNEKNSNRILNHRTHQDKGFISSIISECYKQ
ncbi:hypothetical protein N9R34_01345 [Candidatus Thioglobus sp.]|nr:hypothetical protein [Candidatus Thioglobus sp.]MDB4099177.1 hypothetical protein [Candidatus Thioglobus sp.]